MDMRQFIHTKRRGGAVSTAEMEEFVRGVTDGTIPDYQIAAFLMAVLFQGLTAAETLALTHAMARSGDCRALPEPGRVTVDKHSTGGVGDKTTLIVAPWCAACGLMVPKMSGRGLGHTGGTVDKLEAIPGFRSQLTPEVFWQTARETGLCLAGQSGRMAPADQKLYALRDVTDTVESIPLIAASIMSKKLAAGADCILLDVKTGSGAFMKTPQQARRLAEEMVAIGKGAGRECAALLTDMSRPLGYAIGNALELREALSVLQGDGPSDLRLLSQALTEHMLALAARRDPNAFPARRAERLALMGERLASGEALERLCRMVKAQGGDDHVLRNPEALFHPGGETTVCASQSGYIVEMDTEAFGLAAVALGGGRSRKEEAIDPYAGLILSRKTGDYVEKGQPIAVLYAADAEKRHRAKGMAEAAITYGSSPPEESPLILDVIGADCHA